MELEFQQPAAATDAPSKTLTPTTRNKCSACFRQYKLKDHLIAHMKKAYHSVHQPKCIVCNKHCKSFESLREHIHGPIAKGNCSTIFSEKGCSLCLNVFESPSSLQEHRKSCCLLAPAPLVTLAVPDTDFQGLDDGNDVVVGLQEVSIDCEMDSGARELSLDLCAQNADIQKLDDEKDSVVGLQAVAIDCELVGGGSDGSLDLCARVCMIDEDEKLIYHTYVKPEIPITDYRTEKTGLTEEHLRDAIPLKVVQEKLLQILYNGESIWRVRSDGGKAKLLVGHNLDHNLNCLRLIYPDRLLRDTSEYQPLLKTNLVSHSLKYLTMTYLGYEIQLGTHNIYENCVAAMRLYKRLRSQVHQVNWIGSEWVENNTHRRLVNVFDMKSSSELERMSPDKLLEMSRPNYRCWCLDSVQRIEG